MFYSPKAFLCLAFLEMKALVSMLDILFMQGAIKNVDLNFDAW
jgi:hypothetical protein